MKMASRSFEFLMAMDITFQKVIITCSGVAACIVMTINFFIMLFCLLVIAVVVWAIADPVSLTEFVFEYGLEFWGFMIKFNFPPENIPMDTKYGVAGTFFGILILAWIGYCAASRPWRCLLFMYSVVIVLLLALACVGIYYGPFLMEETGLEEPEGQLAHLIRILMQCCEISKFEGKTEYPWSCCYQPKQDNSTATCSSGQEIKTDCSVAIPEWAEKYQIYVYVSVSSFIFIIFVCSLLRYSLSKPRRTS